MRGGSGEKGPEMAIEYTSRIELGHIIQVVALLLGIGGGAITSFIALRSDIHEVSEKNAKATSEIAIRVTALEARRVGDEAFQARIQADLTRLLDAVGDLRVQIVRKQDIGGTPPAYPQSPQR